MTTEGKTRGDSPRAQRIMVVLGTVALLIAGTGLAFAGGAGSSVDDSSAVAIRTDRPVEASPAATLGDAGSDLSTPEVASQQNLEPAEPPAVSGASQSSPSTSPTKRSQTVAPPAETQNTALDKIDDDEDDDHEVVGPMVRDDGDDGEHSEDGEHEEEKDD